MIAITASSLGTPYFPRTCLTGTSSNSPTPLSHSFLDSKAFQLSSRIIRHRFNSPITSTPLDFDLKPVLVAGYQSWFTTWSLKTIANLSTHPTMRRLHNLQYFKQLLDSSAFCRKPAQPTTYTLGTKPLSVLLTGLL